MKILIIGHARHGKTTVAEMILEEYNLTFKDSSMASAEIFIYDELKTKYGYKTFEECYEDRKQHRDEWFNLICEYNIPDKTRLATEILNRASVYVGMRANDELQACIENNIFDYIIGVYTHRMPEEPKSSFDIDLWKECDFIIPNDGTIEDLRNKINKLHKIFS
jgi:dephospho-CoA kinase